MRQAAALVEHAMAEDDVGDPTLAVPWTKPADLDYDPKKPLPKFGGLFPDGFHVVMWEASVHFFKTDFDEQAMRPFINREAGDFVNYEKLER
jgi:hypothetical protein